MQRQQGAALIIALVFMVMLTLVALSSMHSSTFEVKIARSVKSQLDALNAAEDALYIGEKEVCAQQQKPSDCNGGFTVNFDADANDGFYVSHSVNLPSLSYYENSTAVQSIGTDQSYTVEYLGTVNTEGGSINVGQSGIEKRYLFRVTGYGKSANGGAKLTQSYFMTTD